MDSSAAQLNRFAALTAAFAAAADPGPARRVIQREVLGRWAPDEAELVEFTDAAWAASERELQYAACDLISRRARVAIIHQLHIKRETDADRLFDYCTRPAADSEFFIRKAIGWALREYSKTDPEAVLTYVHAHESELSPLS